MLNRTRMHAMRSVLTNVAVWAESCRGNVASRGNFLFFVMIIFDNTVGCSKYVASSDWWIKE